MQYQCGSLFVELKPIVKEMAKTTKKESAPAAKKPAAKKVAAKKPVAKKVAAKKPVAKKAPVEKKAAVIKPKPAIKKEVAEEKVEQKVERTLMALYSLQQFDSQIDKIRIIRGELPLEVQDLEDEIVGLETRVNNHGQDIESIEKNIKEKQENIKRSFELIKKYEDQQMNVRNNREYDSLSKEIEFQTLEIQLAEKRINESKLSLETKTVEIQNAEELFSERKKDLEDKNSELDDIDTETEKEEDDLEEIFKQESEKYLTVINEAIVKLSSNLDDEQAYETIEKSLHSLKSSARLMGYNDVADIASPFEELFEILHSTTQKIKEEDLTAIKEVAGGLSLGVKGESVDPASLIEKLKSIEVSKPSDSVADLKEKIKEEQLFAGSSDEDEDLLDIFKDESAEYIKIVEKATEALSKNPQDKDALGQLEHAMHSLKTAAKMLGFSEIGQVADSVEKVAVETLKGEINNNAQVNKSISSAIELIKELTAGDKKSSEDVEAIISGLDISLFKKGESGQAEDIAGEKPGTESLELDEQTEMFIKEGWELLEKINRDLVNLEKDPKDKSVIDNLNRTIHTLKGTAQILNFQHIGTLAHKIEDLFAKSKESEQGLSESNMDLAFKAVDTIQELLNSIKKGEEEKGTEANLIMKQIDEQLAKSGSKPLSVEAPEKPVVPPAKPKIIPVEKIQEVRKDTDQVIKISTEYLDNLVNMAAELVINKTQLSAYLDKLRAIGETLDNDKKRLRKTSRTISSFLEKTVGDETGTKIKEEIDKNMLDDLILVSDEFKDVMVTFDTVSKSFRTITQEAPKDGPASRFLFSIGGHGHAPFGRPDKLGKSLYLGYGSKAGFYYIKGISHCTTSLKNHSISLFQGINNLSRKPLPSQPHQIQAIEMIPLAPVLHIRR